jgi:hypothetical protein
MTETPRKTAPTRAESSDGVPESVLFVRTVAIEAPCRAA